MSPDKKKSPTTIENNKIFYNRTCICCPYNGLDFKILPTIEKNRKIPCNGAAYVFAIMTQIPRFSRQWQEITKFSISVGNKKFSLMAHLYSARITTGF